MQSHCCELQRAVARDQDGDRRDEEFCIFPLVLSHIPCREHAVCDNCFLQTVFIYTHFRIHSIETSEHMARMRMLRGMRVLDVVACHREQILPQVGHLQCSNSLSALRLLNDFVAKTQEPAIAGSFLYGVFII